MTRDEMVLALVVAVAPEIMRRHDRVEDYAIDHTAELSLSFAEEVLGRMERNERRVALERLGLRATPDIHSEVDRRLKAAGLIPNAENGGGK